KEKVIRPLDGFSDASDADVVTRGTAVVTNMTGNPNFPNPPVEPLRSEGSGTSYNGFSENFFGDGTIMRLQPTPPGPSIRNRVAYSGYPHAASNWQTVMFYILFFLWVAVF